MPPIPETGNYLLLGLGAIVVIMSILIGSFAVRYRNLKHDLKMIQELSKNEK